MTVAMIPAAIALFFIIVGCQQDQPCYDLARRLEHSRYIRLIHMTPP
jgi:hypothetical protein